MKFLICGVGSIGERHIKNLLALGEEDIILYRQRNAPLRSIKKEFKTFTSIEKALAENPTVAIISNPTSLHIPLALTLAEAGCHVFIEKPLSHNFEGINRLSTIVKRKKIVVQVGFMMRYHPAILQIKKMLEKNAIGEPLSARISWGEYLPAWHPYEDYRQSYAAMKELGGGPIFTLSHDIDLLFFLFGKPNKVYTIKSKNSSLQTSTEQNTETLFMYKNNFIAELHLDYIQLPPHRSWSILGDSGRIEFNYYKNTLTLYKINPKRISFSEKVIDYSEKFERNNLFISEMKEFIKLIKRNETTSTLLDEGITNLKILNAMHISLKQNKIVNIVYS